MRNTGIKLYEKLTESIRAILPIIGIVIVLSFSIAPISPSTLLCFLVGAVLLICGMMFLTHGADLATVAMGERMGSGVTRTRKLWLIILLAFVLGFIITISEPGLQVLASQVPAVPNIALILTVAVGVGVFLAAALLRMLLGIPLSVVLFVLYGAAMILALFVPTSFLGVAFDSGGVATGPVSVPFIMAFGIGVASVRTDRNAADDSFGLVALCTIGPVLAVLILGILFGASGNPYVPPVIPEITSSTELWNLFRTGLPVAFRENAIALAPIIIAFMLFQVFMLKLTRQNLMRISVGLVYTYIGLVLFLTGANVGFVPAGNYIGQVIAALPYRWIIVPIGMVIGFFIIKAEPAVYVLNKQVEEITDGAIPGAAVGMSLSLGVAVSLGLAMMRVLTGLNILWLLIPGYSIALILSFFVPKIFMAIAFDSGGVASGPMAATFLLPFAQGACIAVGGDIVADAFGVVAMVAMTPLIALQILGLVFELRKRRTKRRISAVSPAMAFELLDDDSIIEL